MITRIILTMLLLFPACAYTQEMIYVGHGKVKFDNQVIKKTRELKVILQKQNSVELMRTYKRYVWHKRTAQFFSAVAGYGLASVVEDEFGPKPKFNWSIVGITVGASITAELFHRPANRALKEIVELYNEEVYFQPIRKNSIN